MTPEQKSQVKASWKWLAPHAEHVAETFYNRLFEMDPSLRILFKNDLGEQKRKLMQSLGFVIANLNSPATLLPVIRQFGRRHTLYGAQATLAATAQEAFLQTLARLLEGHFTNETRDAWSALLSLLVGNLRSATSEGPTPRVAA